MMHTVGTIFMQQGILLGHVLCEIVLERFSTHPYHFLGQDSPPPSQGKNPECQWRLGLSFEWLFERYFDFSRLALHSRKPGLSLRIPLRLI